MYWLQVASVVQLGASLAVPFLSKDGIRVLILLPRRVPCLANPGGSFFSTLRQLDVEEASDARSSTCVYAQLVNPCARLGARVFPLAELLCSLCNGFDSIPV